MFPSNRIIHLADRSSAGRYYRRLVITWCGPFAWKHHHTRLQYIAGGDPVLYNDLFHIEVKPREECYIFSDEGTMTECSL